MRRKLTALTAVVTVATSLFAAAPAHADQEWWITEGAGKIESDKVTLWSPGIARTQHQGGGATYLRARGDSCDGDPQLEVKIDGRRVGTIDIKESEQPQDYLLPGYPRGGIHDYSFNFVNDYVTDKCDRNVYLYAMNDTTDYNNPFNVAPPSVNKGYQEQVARAILKPDGNIVNTLALAELLTQPVPLWLGEWTQGKALTKAVEEHLKGDGTPVFVLYGMGGYLAKSPKSVGTDKYLPWVTSFVTAVGDSRAVVILEPDALPFSLDKEREGNLTYLKKAVDILATKDNLIVYIDAGHSKWRSAQETTEALRRVGVQKTRGFTLNIANTQDTDEQIVYGDGIASTLSKNYLIDTSRNGGKAVMETCNPTGVALGAGYSPRPHGALDASMWLKPPAESDGQCQGSPAEGEFWPEYALALVKQKWLIASTPFSEAARTIEAAARSLNMMGLTTGASPRAEGKGVISKADGDLAGKVNNLPRPPAVE